VRPRDVVRSLARSAERLTACHLPLGRADYLRTWRLQERLHARRAAGEIPDTVLTVEHNPVITVGRGGSRANLLVSSGTLSREGIAVYEVERGGDITYHGPGQLVVYPIVDLRAQGRDVHAYIRSLEEAVIGFLADCGVAATRRQGYPGVWVGPRKIASIGVYVRQWVTRHGLALNLDVDRSHFAMIRPCGLDIDVVSLADLVSDPPGVQAAAAGVLAGLSEAFNWRLVIGEP
jgi:lipoate-protein ligase B